MPTDSATDISVEDLEKLAVTALEDLKAKDIVVIDVAEMS